MTTTRAITGGTALGLCGTLLIAGCSSTTQAARPESGLSEPETVASSELQPGHELGKTVSVTAESMPDVDWSSLPSTDMTLSNETLTITEPGTYVLSGSSSAGVVVNSSGYVRLLLSGASIQSATGTAIQVDEAEGVVVETAEETDNTLVDASSRTDAEIDGAIYSSDDLLLPGSGTLSVTANFEDGIVGKDDLWIDSGTISVTSVDDGIRATDSLNVGGATIMIDAAADGMKSSNSVDLGQGKLIITDGKVTIAAGNDAMQAEQSLSVSGGEIDITKSVEGLEAPVIVIDGGDIIVNASDDGVNASASDIIADGLSVTVNDGNIDINMGAGDTDAIDSNGDLTVNGGNLTITAQSPFDYDGVGTFNGGTVVVNGEQVSELYQMTMGGPGAPPNSGR